MSHFSLSPNKLQYPHDIQIYQESPLPINIVSFPTIPRVLAFPRVHLILKIILHSNIPRNHSIRFCTSRSFRKSRHPLPLTSRSTRPSSHSPRPADQSAAWLATARRLEKRTRTARPGCCWPMRVLQWATPLHGSTSCRADGRRAGKDLEGDPTNYQFTSQSIHKSSINQLL